MSSENINLCCWFMLGLCIGYKKMNEILEIFVEKAKNFINFFCILYIILIGISSIGLYFLPHYSTLIVRMLLLIWRIMLIVRILMLIRSTLGLEPSTYSRSVQLSTNTTGRSRYHDTPSRPRQRCRLHIYRTVKLLKENV